MSKDNLIEETRGCDMCCACAVDVFFLPLSQAQETAADIQEGRAASVLFLMHAPVK